MKKTPTYGDAAMTACAVLGFTALLTMLWLVSLPKQEVADCLTWQQQAKDYPSRFYLTQWQADQCAAHNIIINAPVK